MANFIFKMPDIGEGIVETEVVTWHVSPGDEVAEDAPLADVMTDKATVEITSPVSGTVVKTGCQAGEKMVIGADFVEFVLSGETPDAANAPDEKNAAASASVSPAISPDPTANNASDRVDVISDEPVVSADDLAPTPTESDLETPSLPPVKPKIRVVEDGVAASPEQTSIKSPAPTPLTATPASQNGTQHAANGANAVSASVGSEQSGKVVRLTPQREIVPASPAVRRLARDLDLDLATIAGTGRDGRVTKADIKRHCNLPEKNNVARASSPTATVENISTRPATPVKATTGVASNGSSSNDDSGAVDAVPVIGLRRLIAERMQEAKRNIPHFSYIEEVNVGQLENLRQQLNAERDEQQPKLSLLHFVLLAVCRSVAQWPQCNARYDDVNDVLEQYERVHLGVATMTPSGLMVPVVRNACQLSIWEIADEVNRLAEDARAGRLAPDELKGSTITVTSLGALAGVATTPVINRPETSIIGPNKLMQRFELVDGQPAQVSVMNISSSFDHRVVDGYDAACFIQAIRGKLQQPALLFM